MRRLASVSIQLSGCIRHRVLFLPARLFLRYPTRRTDFTKILASRSWIRLCIGVKVISVRFFLDWRMLNLSHLFTVGWRMSLFNFHSRGVVLMTLLFYTHAFIHYFSVSFSILTSFLILVRFRFLHLRVSYTRFKVSKLLILMSMLFSSLVVGRHLWKIFTTRRVDWRSKLFNLMLSLSAGYFFHIRALWSSLCMRSFIYDCFVISVRLLAFSVLNYLYMRSVCIAHFTHSLVTLVIVRIIILRQNRLLRSTFVILSYLREVSFTVRSLKLALVFKIV